MKSSKRLFPALLSCVLVAGPLAFAQSTPSASAPARPEDETVVLSPFVVTSTQETGYLATSTLAGTRLNTSLKDIGAAVSVYTPEFLEDINVSKLEDILAYTMSTEGGGQNGNFSGIVGENSAGVRDDPSSVNRVRALAQATRTRDFFASDIPSDTFSFGTLTVSRGPNAILAGVGNAGGIMDAALRKAVFNNNYRLVSRFSSYGSHREELHLNQVLIPKRLAVRLDLLNDDQSFRQQPAYAKDQRFYTAVNYNVIEPKRGSFLGRGTFRGNFEKGKIEGVPPDPLTPTFTVGQWFNDITPKYQWWGYGTPLVTTPTALNAATLSALRNSSGVGVVPTGSGVIQGFPLYAQFALVYADPTSNSASMGFTNAALAGIQGFQGTIPATLPGGTAGSVRSTGDANRQRAGFVRTHLSDPNIFNFYDQLMTGVFDQRDQDFDALDLRYEQLFMDGKAGFEIAYNDQTFTRRRDFSIPTGGNDEGIMVDVNYYLSVKDNAGQPILNPNFGRPFISTTDVFRDQMNRINRESYQVTAFFKHDFTGSDSKWVKLLGRHTVSALLFNTSIDRFNRTYASTWDPTASPSPQASLNNAAVSTFGTQVNGWFYVGPSLLNVARVEDVRLQAITAARPQSGQTYKVRVYDPVSRTFVTSDQKPLRVLQTLIDQQEDLNSTAFALQSHWLKDHIVTVVGWREDNDEAFTSLTPPRLANGNLDEAALTFQPAVAQVKRSWDQERRWPAAAQAARGHRGARILERLGQLQSRRSAAQHLERGARLTDGRYGGIRDLVQRLPRQARSTDQPVQDNHSGRYHYHHRDRRRQPFRLRQPLDRPHDQRPGCRPHPGEFQLRPPDFQYLQRRRPRDLRDAPRPVQGQHRSRQELQSPLHRQRRHAAMGAGIHHQSLLDERHRVHGHGIRGDHQPHEKLAHLAQRRQERGREGQRGRRGTGLGRRVEAQPRHHVWRRPAAGFARPHLRPLEYLL